MKPRRYETEVSQRSTQTRRYAAIAAALLAVALAGCSTLSSFDSQDFANASTTVDYGRIGEG